jgi:zinc metalloprotease ZmpB
VANNAGEVVVGPFSWMPTHVGHECMFMIVSANGDASNVDHIAAGDSIPEWRLVPHDNNIGQRNVAPVPGGGTSGLVEEFEQLSFEAKNPLTHAAVISIEPTLPPMLSERGWTLAFANRGGGAFPLEPGESRQVAMRLGQGADFTADDVAKTLERTIRVSTRADGILIGGMSYELDPHLEHPRRPEGNRPGPGEPGHEHDEHCGCVRDERIDESAETLLQYLKGRRQRIREVEIRKVIVEIEFDDCED